VTELAEEVEEVLRRFVDALVRDVRRGGLLDCRLFLT